MRLYLDANVIIYAVEGKDDGLRTAARAWLVEGSKSGAEFRTSMFTEFECHVRPLREKDFALVDTFSAFLRQPSWQLVPISFEVLRRAAVIRAEHNLKPPDAIQAASAIEAKSDLFLTNDYRRFDRVASLKIAEVMSSPRL
jgi:predicted nucleic acid-binding protein